jgi:hypothetical protein
MIAGNGRDGSEGGQRPDASVEQGKGSVAVREITTQKDDVWPSAPGHVEELRRHVARPPMTEVQVTGIEKAHPVTKTQAYTFPSDGERPEGAELEGRKAP